MCCGFLLCGSARGGEYASVATSDSAAFSPTTNASDEYPHYRDDDSDDGGGSDNDSESNSIAAERPDKRLQPSSSSPLPLSEDSRHTNVSPCGQPSQVDEVPGPSTPQSRPERRLVSARALARSACVAFMFAFCTWQLEALDHKWHLTGRNIAAPNLPFPKGSPAAVLYLSQWTELLFQLLVVALLSIVVSCQSPPRAHAMASLEVAACPTDAAAPGSGGGGVENSFGGPRCGAESTECPLGTRIVAAGSMVAACASLSTASGVQFVMAGSYASGVVLLLFLARCVRLPCTSVPVLAQSDDDNDDNSDDEVQSAPLGRPAVEAAAMSTTSVATIFVSCLMIASPWGMYAKASWWFPFNLVVGLSAAAGFARFFVFELVVRRRRHRGTRPSDSSCTTAAALEQLPTKATLAPLQEINRMIFQVVRLLSKA